MPVTILAADDDKAILHVYARIFAGAGYTLTMAETFEEAAGLLRKNDYDLLITDLMFPDGLGTELIKMFNASKAGARSLLVTGTTNARDLLSLEGIDEYVEKPFRVEDLLLTVSRVLA